MPASTAASSPAPDVRLDDLASWLATLPTELGLRIGTLRAASADASFRRYFRLDAAAGTLIAMDAPPAQEDSRPYVKVAALLHAAGLNAPRILAQDLAQGFLLLTDLGTQTFLHVLDEDNADALYGAAIDALITWQRASRPDVLPPYDTALLTRELALFPDWYVGRHLQHTLTPAQRQTLERSNALLIEAALAQPRVYVHRDYMPRNLMVSSPNPGILDFQDAVYGPVTYDVVSLMRDAFISWEEARVLDWAVRYWERARQAALPVGADFGEFYKAFEWMGLQRHLKVLGIFARINYRDGKPQYLADTPRFIRYVRGVTQRYGELKPLALLVDQLDGVAVRNGFSF
jgi:N-acetylmuramate 1-kinase